jgi:hypothetical protein
MYGVTHFLHNQVKSAYEAVAPDPTRSQFETKRVRIVWHVLALVQRTAASRRFSSGALKKRGAGDSDSDAPAADFCSTQLRHYDVFRLLERSHGCQCKRITGIDSVSTLSLHGPMNVWSALQLLTPEEFVTAGDHLVSTVGSWAWCDIPSCCEPTSGDVSLVWPGLQVAEHALVEYLEILLARQHRTGDALYTRSPGRVRAVAGLVGTQTRG